MLMLLEKTKLAKKQLVKKKPYKNLNLQNTKIRFAKKNL
jgi:hypothetical protein